MKLLEYPKKDLLRNFKALINMSLEEVIALQNEWNEIYKKNEKIHLENIQTKNAQLEKIERTLEQAGLSVYKYKVVKLRTQKVGYTPWFKKNIVDELDKKYGMSMPSKPFFNVVAQVVDEVRLEVSTQTYRDLVETYKSLKLQYDTAKGIGKKKGNPILMDLSLKFAEENKIDLSGIDENKIVPFIHEKAIEKYLETELPDGTAIDNDGNCEYCETYLVGERRCECGNRRIGVEVEGNLKDGFYWYLSAY